MDYEEQIARRLEHLIAMGERVLGTRHIVVTQELVNRERFFEWQTNSLTFLKSVMGSEGIHFGQFDGGCCGPLPNDVELGLGVLRAAKSDLEGGHLKRVEDLVSADIFTDFLDMADYLLEQGYKDPAASLVGAVLEDGLRRIARGRGITLASKESISSINKKLADAKVYNLLVRKEVEVWNETRNNADHGHFEEYGVQQVMGMLAGVRAFLAQHLK